MLRLEEPPGTWGSGGQEDRSSAPGGAPCGILDPAEFLCVQATHGKGDAEQALAIGLEAHGRQQEPKSVQEERGEGQISSGASPLPALNTKAR